MASRSSKKKNSDRDRRSGGKRNESKASKTPTFRGGAKTNPHNAPGFDGLAKDGRSKCGFRLTHCTHDLAETFDVPNQTIKTPLTAETQIRMNWTEGPFSVFVVKKLNDKHITSIARKCIRTLTKKYNLCVYVEAAAAADYTGMDVRAVTQDKLHRLSDLVDFGICLGGDGTFLYAASLFDSSSGTPPMASFALGSLGFLTPFDINDFDQVVEDIFSGNFYLTLRKRLKAQVRRADADFDEARYHVMNEVVVDRGPSSYLTSLDCFADNKYMTRVQADGVIVATATGSTAYSLAAGGSMAHPLVPATLLTPICAHSLSFRPVLLPDSTVVKIQVPEDARAGAWAAFDGKHRVELKPGDSVIIVTSSYPVPAINKGDTTSDWFESLRGSLQWNVRAQQKAFSG